MSLVAAKCTNCGGELQVEASREAAVCEYCGAAFIVEKAINNYNINQVSHLHADVVQVMDSEGADNLYKSAVTYLNMRSTKEASETFEKMIKKYPFDTRGWFGRLQVETNDFTTLRPDIKFYTNVLNMYETYLSVLAQSGGNEKENIRRAEYYIDQLDSAVEKTISTDSDAVYNLDLQYKEAEKRLGNPSAKIAKLKKKKKSFAVRFSVLAGLAFLFVWIHGFLAGAGEQEFFGPWVYDYTGAYWDFWRTILLIPDQIGTLVVGFVGGFVGIPLVIGLCCFVISRKWKKIDKRIAPLEKDQAELTSLAMNRLNSVVRGDDTQKQLPVLREKRRRISQIGQNLGA